MTDDDAPPGVPVAKAPARTLVMDAGSGRQLLWIDGLVTLPVAARIQLMEPRADAMVTAVRLWSAADAKASTLVLEVMLVAPGESADLP
jgi:hypothetical protein